MSRVLITGANGFVGSRLVQYLRDKGHDITRAVRDYTKEGGDTVPTGDIGPDTDWTAALTDCEVVVHLAARVHIMNDTASNPVDLYRAVNFDGTLNLARQAARSGVRRFVYLSTIKVNGESTDRRPFTEDTDYVPTDPYAVSKWQAENSLLELSTTSDMDVVIIRPPLVYGPGVKANFLQLINLVRKGLFLPFGSVNNARSMVYLDNLVDFIYCCIQNPDAGNQVFLVSDDCDVSTPDLIRHLSRAMNSPDRLLSIPVFLLSGLFVLLGKRKLIPRLLGSLQVDISKARNLLGWKPLVSMQDGMASTVNWALSRET